MKKTLFVLMGPMVALPAFAESQAVLDGPGITIWANDISPDILPAVDYSTVSTDTKAVAVTPQAAEKTFLQNVTVDGSIRVRYSTGNRPSFSTQRIGINFKSGNVAARVEIQQCEDLKN